MLQVDIKRLTEPQEEAERIMRICNACRYCESLCAVFPAMEMRRNFDAGDLNYLANLCHNCGACYHACQYAPPHDFKVNVPETFSEVRAESYQSYVWPVIFASFFEKNGFFVVFVAVLSFFLFLAGFMAYSDPSVMFGRFTGTGAFYQIMPHNAMVLLFGVVFLYAIMACVMGFRRFWKDISGHQVVIPDGVSVWKAMMDAASLKYLDGDGAGCGNESDRPQPLRRLYHHFTFYGFLLCFASTSVATLYHYIGGWEAPYGYFSLPVILGTIGGIGITVGPIGLYCLKRKRAAKLGQDSRGMDSAFLIMLAAVGVSGLLLLVLRSTVLMGSLLALHLALVMAFFLTMPYGKFVHGIYRFGALVRFAMERRLSYFTHKAMASKPEKTKEY